MNQHKWHKEIKAWADGAEIEYFDELLIRWLDVLDMPRWNSSSEYRIKPQLKKPQDLYAYRDFGGQVRFYDTALHRGQMLLGKIKLEME